MPSFGVITGERKRISATKRFPPHERFSRSLLLCLQSRSVENNTSKGTVIFFILWIAKLRIFYGGWTSILGCLILLPCRVQFHNVCGSQLFITSIVDINVYLNSRNNKKKKGAAPQGFPLRLQNWILLVGNS